MCPKNESLSYPEVTPTATQIYRGGSEILVNLLRVTMIINTV